MKYHKLCKSGLIGIIKTGNKERNRNNSVSIKMREKNMKKMNKEVQNKTEFVTLEELFEMRNYFTDVIEVMQKDFDVNTSLDASIEGDGFNISFPLKRKDEERCKIFSVRVEVDEYWTNFNNKEVA
jgi:hypothetical protein